MIIPEHINSFERGRYVIAEVAKSHGFTIDEIKGEARFRELVAARRAAVMAMAPLGLSCAQMGRLLNRDHTSIMHLRGTRKRNRKAG